LTLASGMDDLLDILALKGAVSFFDER
jgi:hypothetical protein